MTRKTAEERRRLRRQLYEELEHIDGVHWNGRARAVERERRADSSDEIARTKELVPVEAYGLE